MDIIIDTFNINKDRDVNNYYTVYVLQFTEHNNDKYNRCMNTYIYNVFSRENISTLYQDIKYIPNIRNLGRLYVHRYIYIFTYLYKHKYISKLVVYVYTVYYTQIPSI